MITRENLIRTEAINDINFMIGKLNLLKQKIALKEEMFGEARNLANPLASLIEAEAKLIMIKELEADKQ